MMRITALEEYGLRCLLNLARLGVDRQMSIAEVAEREAISVPYASKLLALLRKGGLVVASRGRAGGFTIARSPDEISLYDVLTVLGGPLVDPNHCNRFAGQRDTCVHLGNCSIYHVFQGLADHVQDFLTETSLEDMINRKAVDFARRKSSGPMLYEGPMGSRDSAENPSGNFDAS